MTSLTTSYFAVMNRNKGTHISIARNIPESLASKLEIMTEFAPSFKLLKEYKNGQINWQQYEKQYLSEQEKHLKESPKNFQNLLERATMEDIILYCYEKYVGPNTKCHRLSLYQLLRDLSKKSNIDVNFIDENFN